MVPHWGAGQRTVPGLPVGLTATPGNGQVSLVWIAPSSNGGSAITDYVVQYSSNNGSTWITFPDGTSTATSATVTGLANGTSYIFRVAAVNAAGRGQISLPSDSRTPLPGAPSKPVCVAGNGSVGLSWTLPSMPGLPPITDYLIRYSMDGGASWTTYAHKPSTALRTTVVVPNGKTYVFQVAPIVEIGRAHV